MISNARCYIKTFTTMKRTDFSNLLNHFNAHDYWLFNVKLYTDGHSIYETFNERELT